jgi:hypothetical protein
LLTTRRVRLLPAAPIVLLAVLLSLDFLLTLAFDLLLALPLEFKLAVLLLTLTQLTLPRLADLIVTLPLPTLFALLRPLNLFLPSLFEAFLSLGSVLLSLRVALSLLFPTLLPFLRALNLLLSLLFPALLPFLTGLLLLLSLLLRALLAFLAGLLAFLAGLLPFLLTLL